MSAGYPTRAIEVERELIIKQGEPIFRTVMPNFWETRSGKRYHCCPIKTDVRGQIEMSAASKRTDDEKLGTVTKQVGKGLAFKEGLSDADMAAAKRMADSMTTVHHANISQYYEEGDFRRSNYGYGYGIDATAYGAELKESSAYQGTDVEESGFRKVVPLADIEKDLRADQASTTPVGLLGSDKSREILNVPDKDGGINKYASPGRGTKDETIVMRDLVLRTDGTGFKTQRLKNP